ncbi:polyketide synthase [Actinomadura craniellae]|uniref:Polyketide synthase n=1 Tax=Actinomadura craniellae TaxID=2231787 RepID=A0A365GZM2_9ACTN|nr:acyl carrier protein [Actinomadura craniellae]RAY12271.1 polyketide synthase [Actinomadura craniellae]
MFRRKKKVEFEGPRTAESIRRWLIEHLAERVGESPENIDTKKTFEAYGLDSRVAVQVSGSLEKIVERRLSPGLLYEYQTVDDLSGYLAKELGLAGHS